MVAGSVGLGQAGRVDLGLLEALGAEVPALEDPRVAAVGDRRVDGGGVGRGETRALLREHGDESLEGVTGTREMADGLGLAGRGDVVGDARVRAEVRVDPVRR